MNCKTNWAFVVIVSLIQVLLLFIYIREDGIAHGCVGFLLGFSWTFLLTIPFLWSKLRKGKMEELSNGTN